MEVKHVYRKITSLCIYIMHLMQRMYKKSTLKYYVLPWPSKVQNRPI
jgi:hypothetical protein